MAVPQPSFGPTGFVTPDESDILVAVKEQINAAFGNQLNMADETPQGQIAVSMTAAIGNSNDAFVFLSQQMDPAFNSGRYQDGIARIYFIERNPALPTAVTCTIGGIAGLTIPEGALATDDSGNVYALLGDATIGIGGTVSAQFANLIPGPTPCPAGTLTTIYQAVNGWDSITNPADGVLGQDTETRAAFEERRRLSVAQNANGSLAAILGAVLNINGVLDAYVTENETDNPLAIGGITLGPHTLYVAVSGGDPLDVATAIWSRKAPGCGYNGNTSVTVYDQSPYYNPPYPAYSVHFQTAIATTVIFDVTIHNSAAVPANAAALIQAAIIAAFAGGDGGPRARIGSVVYASRFYAPVILAGSWVQLVHIKVGCINSASAQFTASISGTAMTVTSVASGVIAIGQTVLGAGVTPGTKITGGAGVNWTVSISQTAGSGTKYGCLANNESVAILPTQAPVVSANDIVVTLA